jgi:hypothetical protein
MREICTYGSEGGATQSNASFLPLYGGKVDQVSCGEGEFAAFRIEFRVEDSDGFLVVSVPK